jgi:hypothetical protein
MHGTSTLGRLNKISLPLHLMRAEGRDEERPSDPVQRRVKAGGLLQVANHRLDARASKSSGLLRTPYERSHWHTTRCQLPERGTPNKTGGADNENHGTSTCMLAPVLPLTTSWVEPAIKHKISNSIWAPTCAVLDVGSYCGAISTTSPPMMLSPYRHASVIGKFPQEFG